MFCVDVLFGYRVLFFGGGLKPIVAWIYDIHSDATFETYIFLCCIFKVLYSFVITWQII